MKKQVLSIILTAFMVSAMSVTAFAAGISPSSASQSGSTSVSATVNPSFTVTIPESVKLGESTTVSASGVIVDEGKEVVVKLTGTSGANNAFTLSNGKTGTITYEVKKGSTALTIGSTVLTVNPKTSDNGSQELTFNSTTKKPKYSGSYTGTVTFTVSVENDN